MTTTKPPVSKHFSTSILLWMRQDRPRSAGMDRWRGPHSGIIAATPGLSEYRQIHLAEENPGRWPATDGVETAIPADRRVDGLAEVTFENALSPLAGRAQTALAFEDEVNIFRRTLLYAGPPGTSRWYDVAPGERPGARLYVHLRRRDGEGTVAFHRFVKKELVPALVATRVLRELRTQVFLPWTEKTWDTPDVAHDNPADQHLHAALILGFADESAREEFLTGDAARTLSDLLAPHVSAVHAYDVTAALTYVSDGVVLPSVQE
ncbi:strictosidine synthase [Rathayibacter sp. SD072]|uniref:strictosidine synthase n=1 Tax=Rathayibacter sp. SD072 TaxID=2781731 RepID=UPI001A96C93C|nr:strictosidine synthase [Rathayibacter sp. SD072]MBO0984160.1 strictosidine synthase [Rathayibacter sp. SD072]